MNTERPMHLEQVVQSFDLNDPIQRAVVQGLLAQFVFYARPQPRKRRPSLLERFDADEAAAIRKRIKDMDR